jgi:hypothetical protein
MKQFGARFRRSLCAALLRACLGRSDLNNLWLATGSEKVGARAMWHCLLKRIKYFLILKLLIL